MHIRMIEACLAYGIPKNSLEIEMFLVPKMVIIGEPPLRIEILKNWTLLISSMLIPELKQWT